MGLRANTYASADELIGWTKERLAPYKYPRIVEVCDQLPMSSTGKILKRMLRARADADHRPQHETP